MYSKSHHLFLAGWVLSEYSSFHCSNLEAQDVVLGGGGVGVPVWELRGAIYAAPKVMVF